MDSRVCGLCGEHENACGGVLGLFVGPISGVGDASCWVHRLCALWSPEVYQTDAGTLKGAGAAVRRGRQIKCSYCGQKGGSIGCRVERCPLSYHFRCGRVARCSFYPDTFQLACKGHAHLFPDETVFGGTANAAAAAAARAAVAAARAAAAAAAAAAGGGLREGTGFRQPLGLSTVHNAQRSARRRSAPPPAPPSAQQPSGAKRRRVDMAAAAAHVAAAKQALAGFAVQHSAGLYAPSATSGYGPGTPGGGGGMVGSGGTWGPAGGVGPGAVQEDADELEWAWKEARRAAKDTVALAPIILAGRGGGPGAVAEARADAALQTGSSASLAPAPATVAPSKTRMEVPELKVWGAEAPGFESLGGLPHVVQALKEMALMPLLYPGLLSRLGVAAPRGILLHGVPGSGKTAAVRALAGELARAAPRPVALFVRKGADCLGKYVGDAERTLRLLFEEARRRAPSVIFLDELDALAPARSVRACTSDQVHASVVSTLLSLMDGMEDRGMVLVVGATNRPDSLDPALRRPGRFDREVAFGLPGPEQRADILAAITRSWPAPPAPATLKALAAATEGFAGADLAALASAAVVAAARRCHPQLAQELQQGRAGHGLRSRPAEDQVEGKGDGHTEPSQGLHDQKQAGKDGLRQMEEPQLQEEQTGPVIKTSQALEAASPEEARQQGGESGLAAAPAQALAAAPEQTGAAVPAAGAAAAANLLVPPQPLVLPQEPAGAGGFLSAFANFSKDVLSGRVVRAGSRVSSRAASPEPAAEAAAGGPPADPSSAPNAVALAEQRQTIKADGTGHGEEAAGEEAETGRPWARAMEIDKPEQDADAAAGESAEQRQQQQHVPQVKVQEHREQLEQQQDQQQEFQQLAQQGDISGDENRAHEADAQQAKASSSSSVWVEEVEVLEGDWAAALASAPPACSHREASALLSGAAGGACGVSPGSGQAADGGPGTAAAASGAVPHHMAPFLLPALEQALHALAAYMPNPRPPCLERVLSSLGEQGLGNLSALETLLFREGMLCGPPPVTAGTTSALQQASAEVAAESVPAAAGQGPATATTSPQGSRGTGPAGRLMLCPAGSERGARGDTYMVAQLLLRMMGGARVLRLSLPALVVAGEGDPLDGLIRLLGDAAAGVGGSAGAAAGRGLLILHLHQLERWAVAEEEACEDTQSGSEDEGGAGSKPRSPTAPAKECAGPSFLGGATSLQRSQPAAASTGPRASHSVQAVMAVVPARGQGKPQQQQELVYELHSAPDHSTVVAHQAHHLLPVRSPARSQAAGAGAAAGAQATTAAGGAGEAGQGETRGLASTPLWAAFSQQLDQLCARYPVLVLATSGLPPSSLPPSIAGFFGAGGPAAAGDRPEGGSVGHVVLVGDRGVSTVAPRSFGAGTTSGQVALQRAAAHAAHALLLPQLKLLVRAHCARGRGPTDAGPPNQPGAPEAAATAEGEGAKELSSSATSIPLSNSELALGLRLVSQVQAALQAMGQAMLQDPSIMLARCPEGGLANGGVAASTGEGEDVPGPPRIGRPLREVAQQAAQGAFKTLDDFCAAVGQAVARVKRGWARPAWVWQAPAATAAGGRLPQQAKASRTKRRRSVGPEDAAVHASSETPAPQQGLQQQHMPQQEQQVHAQGWAEHAGLPSKELSCSYPVQLAAASRWLDTAEAWCQAVRQELRVGELGTACLVQHTLRNLQQHQDPVRQQKYPQQQDGTAVKAKLGSPAETGADVEGADAAQHWAQAWAAAQAELLPALEAQVQCQLQSSYRVPSSGAQLDRDLGSVAARILQQCTQVLSTAGHSRAEGVQIGDAVDQAARLLLQVLSGA